MREPDREGLANTGKDTGSWWVGGCFEAGTFKAVPVPQRPTPPVGEVTIEPVRRLPAHVSADDRRLLRTRRTDLLIVVVVGLLAALGVRSWVLQLSYIPSESMLPTLQVGDRVLVSKVAYRVGPPARGHIVVFETPDGLRQTLNSDELIKRVVGLEGETVSSVDGVVHINGHALVERYLPEGVVTEIDTPVTVPEGHVFVLGDNREASADSRVFGPVPVDTITGRAVLRIWPASRFGALGTEGTNLNDP